MCIKSRLINFLYLFPFLVYVNVLFIIFSLPVITLFPSLFALVHIIDNAFKNKNTSLDSIFSQFKHYFKYHWKRSIKFSILGIPIILRIGLDFFILNSSTNQSPLVITFKYAIALFSIILYCLFHYMLYLFTTRRITV